MATIIFTDLGYIVGEGSKPAHSGSKPAPLASNPPIQSGSKPAPLASNPPIQSGSKPAPSHPQSVPPHIPLEITFSHPAGVHIDLHTHILTLAWWHTAFPIDLQTIWRSAQPYQDSTGMELQRLSPEVTFLHLCLHLFNHGIFNPRFHSYFDLALLIRKYGANMHWDHILQLTKDWHMLNIVYWVSQVLGRDFQTKLPIQIVRAGLVPALHPNSLQQRFIQAQFHASAGAGENPATSSKPSPWRSAFLLRLALIDNLSILPKLFFMSIFPNAGLRIAIHNQPRTLLQHWQTYTCRFLKS